MKFRLILFLLLICGVTHSQVGGKKREKVSVKSHRRTVKQRKTSWSYHKTPDDGKTTNVRQYRIPFIKKSKRTVFLWNVTKGKRESRKIQERINRQRSKRRIRGNDVFHKRKYF